MKKNIFTQEEINLVREQWFLDFDWDNVNVKHEWNWGNLALYLIFNMQVNTMELPWTDNEENRERVRKLLRILNKLISLKEFDVNSFDNRWWTLLWALIMFWNTELVKKMLEMRNDFDISNYSWDWWSYEELASWNKEILGALKEYRMRNK
jgi:hypothetical protein